MKDIVLSKAGWLRRRGNPLSLNRGNAVLVGTCFCQALCPLPNAIIAPLAPPESFNHFSCRISLCFWSKNFLRTKSDSRWGKKSSFFFFELYANTFPFSLWLHEEMRAIRMWWKLAFKSPEMGHQNSFLCSFCQSIHLACLFSGGVWSLMLLCIMSETKTPQGAL